MSTQKPILGVGFLAIGLFALPGGALLSGREQSQERDPVVTSSASVNVPGANPRRGVLLLHNGRILIGELIEEPGSDSYGLRQAGGVIKFPKRDVVKAFGSLRELYRYRVASLPKDDPEVHLELAKWCLEQELTLEAKEQLRAVLAITPSHPVASRMVESIKVAEENAASRDPEVLQASGEAPADGKAPNPLNEAVYNQARRKMNDRGLGRPVVFDLSAAASIARASEFTRYVQPVLQRSCAQCHNERYPGEFQLVQVRNRREDTQDAARANLDAVLPLVDREIPSRSPLLTQSLVAHGGSKRAVFSGNNDRNFQILRIWVDSLRAKPPADSGVRGVGIDVEQPAEFESFGADRNRGAASGSLEPLPAPLPEVPKPKASGIVHHVEGVDPRVPAATTFPQPGIPPVSRKNAAPPPEPSKPAASPSKSADPAPPPLPDAKSEAKKPAKKRLIDPALLEKVLKERRGD